MLKLKRIFEQNNDSCFENLNNILCYHRGSVLDPDQIFSSSVHNNHGTGFYLYVLDKDNDSTMLEPRHKDFNISYYIINNGKFLKDNKDGFDLVKSMGLYPVTNPQYKFKRSQSVFYNMFLYVYEHSGEFFIKLDVLEFFKDLSIKLKNSGIDGVCFNQGSQKCITVFNAQVLKPYIE